MTLSIPARDVPCWSPAWRQPLPVNLGSVSVAALPAAPPDLLSSESSPLTPFELPARAYTAQDMPGMHYPECLHRSNPAMRVSLCNLVIKSVTAQVVGYSAEEGSANPEQGSFGICKMH